MSSTNIRTTSETGSKNLQDIVRERSFRLAGHILRVPIQGYVRWSGDIFVPPFKRFVCRKMSSKEHQQFPTVELQYF